MAVVQNYSRELIKIVVPIKAEEYLNWKKTDIAKFVVISIAVGRIPTMIFLRFYCDTIMLQAMSKLAF